MTETTFADLIQPYALDRAYLHALIDRALAQLEKRHTPVPNLSPASFRIVGSEVEIVDAPPPPRRYVAPEGTRSIASNMFTFGVIVRELLDERAGADRLIGLIERCEAHFEHDRPTPTAMRAVLQDDVHAAFVEIPPRAYVASDAREQGLVEALRANPADEALRAVYADWLEEHGDDQRAAFMRGREAAIGEHTWRSIVSRARVVRCRAPECPSTWDAFTPSRFDNLRSCAECSRVVHYCTRLPRVHIHRTRRERVVLDATLNSDQADVAYEFPDTSDHVGANPPRPSRGPASPVPDDNVVELTTVLGRFFGWFKRNK